MRAEWLLGLVMLAGCGISQLPSPLGETGPGTEIAPHASAEQPETEGGSIGTSGGTTDLQFARTRVIDLATELVGEDEAWSSVMKTLANGMFDLKLVNGIIDENEDLIPAKIEMTETRARLFIDREFVTKSEEAWRKMLRELRTGR